LLNRFLAYPTGYIRSGDTYTSNGTAERIKEIIAYLQDESLEITFRIDSGYFDDNILATIESFGCTYVIKGKVNILNKSYMRKVCLKKRPLSRLYPIFPIKSGWKK